MITLTQQIMKACHIFICLLFVMGVCTLHADYDPKVQVPKEQAEDVKSGVSALKRLPRLLREACIAEKLGLLFMPDGGSAYSDKESFHSTENVRFYPVKKGARFVGSDGKLYDFNEVLKSKFKPNSKAEETWKKVKRAIYNYGEDVVFSAFKDEVTQLVLLTAKNRLYSMPMEYRCACLVQYTGWAYNKEGKSAVRTWRYVSRSSVNRCEGTKRQGVWNELHDDALFTGPDGKERSFKTCIDTRGNHYKAWVKVGLCVDLIGIKDVLSVVPKERDVLKAYYEQKVGEQAP